MAEYQLDEWSGFFNAMLENGQYDRVYNAEHFASYFANFISSGVFADPSDQLKVSAKEGLIVTIKAGRSYIKGYAHTLKKDGEITFSPNMENQGIINKVVVEYIPSERIAKIRVIENAASALPDNEYQLVLCSFTLPVGESEITNAMIIDRRPDKTYCGFVTGLVQQIDFTTLMEQEKAQFAEWFEAMKGQLSEDAAGNLQNQIDALGETYLPRTEYVKNEWNEDGYVSMPYKYGWGKTWSMGRKGGNPGWNWDWRLFDKYVSFRDYEFNENDDNTLRLAIGSKGGGYLTRISYAFLMLEWGVLLNGSVSGSLGVSSLYIKCGRSCYQIDDVIYGALYDEAFSPGGFSFPSWAFANGEKDYSNIYSVSIPVYHSRRDYMKIGILNVVFSFIKWETVPEQSVPGINYQSIKNKVWQKVFGISVLKSEFIKESGFSDVTASQVIIRPYGVGAGFDPTLCQNDSYGWYMDFSITD